MKISRAIASLDSDVDEDIFTEEFKERFSDYIVNLLEDEQ